MQMTTESGLAVRLENSKVQSIRSKDGRFVAEYLPYSTKWMVGAIEGKAFADDDEREQLARTVMACIETVEQDQLPYSTCTDGRVRECLDDKTSKVPLREQVVGTDTMMAFVAAEALGERFYKEDKELYASVIVRLNRVVSFLHENGLKPTAHVACGAAGSFTGVMARATQFINSADYTARLQALMPTGTYDAVLHRFVVGGYQSRLDSNVYEGYYDTLVSEIIREQIGSDAVEHYVDDGCGVHGHQEQIVVYLDNSIVGQAINPNHVSAECGGSQVFGVNAARIQRLAKLFSDNGRDQMDYATALLAMHDFSAAGHGTLAHGMETMIVRPTS